MGRFHSLLLPLLLAVSLARHKFVFGKQVNRTFDDTFGDPTAGQFVIYTPPLTSPTSLWVDQTCQECTFLPSDPIKAFNGTFHEVAYNPFLGIPISFQLNFTGTAIYVFFTLVNNASTFVNFTVDDTPAGFFTHNANTAATQYQVLVFSHTNLQNSQHSLLASNTPSSAFSYVNFDYAVYTQDDGIPEFSSSSSSDPTLSETQTAPSQSSSSLSPSATQISGAHQTSTTKKLHSKLSRAPTISVQLPTTMTTVIDTNTASDIPSSTSRPTSAAKKTSPTRLAIAGAVLGPAAVLAAAGLLLRYIQSRNQANLKKRDPTPFTEVSPEAADPEIFVPPSASKRRSRGRISALLSEKVKDALRRTRQEEIDERLRTLRGEIIEISSKLSARGAMVPANENWSTTAQQHAIGIDDESTSSRRLRRILHAKKRQIEHVEKQRQSPWALGLSEDSPLEVEDSLL